MSQTLARLLLRLKAVLSGTAVVMLPWQHCRADKAQRTVTAGLCSKAGASMLHIRPSYLQSEQCAKQLNTLILRPSSVSASLGC
jgi:hypothetical protein